MDVSNVWENTEHSDEYQVKLTEYLDQAKVKRADPGQDYLSENYRHTGQEYADFLDFRDEWKYRAEELLRNAKQDFIRRFFYIPRRRMTCGDHSHIFGKGTEEEADHEPFEESGVFYDDTCWADEIFRNCRDISLEQDESKLILLPENLLDYLHHIVGVRLATEGLPPTRLSFAEYKMLWWGKEGTDQARTLLGSRTLPRFSVQLLDKVERQLSVDSGLEFSMTEQTVVFNHADEIENQHGFHVALRTYHEPKELIHKINQSRHRVGGEKLSSHRIGRAMLTCERCIGSPNIRQARHPQMLIYAPPGMGKTTAMDEELITGIDTDWLVRGTNFKNELSWFWNQGFTIITNDITKVLSARTKVFGFANYNVLRKTPDGKTTYTSKEEVENVFKSLGNDGLLFTSDTSYLGDQLFKMMIAGNYYHYVVDRVLCGEKGYTRYKYPLGRPAMEVASGLAVGKDTLLSQNQRKRNKWRDKGRPKRKPAKEFSTQEAHQRTQERQSNV